MVKNRIDALEDFRKQLEGADVDLLREMVKVFAEQLMGADADALCNAGWVAGGGSDRGCEGGSDRERQSRIELAYVGGLRRVRGIVSAPVYSVAARSRTPVRLED